MMMMMVVLTAVSVLDTLNRHQKTGSFLFEIENTYLPYVYKDLLVVFHVELLIFFVTAMTPPTSGKHNITTKPNCLWQPLTLTNCVDLLISEKKFAYVHTRSDNSNHKKQNLCVKIMCSIAGIWLCERKGGRGVMRSGWWVRICYMQTYSRVPSR